MNWIIIIECYNHMLYAISRASAILAKFPGGGHVFIWKKFANILTNNIELDSILNSFKES